MECRASAEQLAECQPLKRIHSRSLVLPTDSSNYLLVLQSSHLGARGSPTYVDTRTRPSNCTPQLHHMKLATACDPCRLSRRRCEHRAIGQACALCESKRIRCSFVPTRPSKAKTIRPAEAPIGSQPTLLDVSDTPAVAAASGSLRIEALPKAVVREMVEHYLTKVHNRPHSLFHPQSLMHSVDDGCIKRTLLYAICSMGCRFTADASLASLEPAFVAEAKRLLQVDFENVCVENIQACILVANLCAAQLQQHAEALYFRKLLADSVVPLMHRHTGRRRLGNIRC